MPLDEFDKLKENVGGLITLNSCHSTNVDENVSNGFALLSLDHPNVKAIFFIINIDFTLILSPVACLDETLSYFPDEEEYLWGMSTVFRIRGIEEKRNGLCHIHLTTTNEDDPQL